MAFDDGAEFDADDTPEFDPDGGDGLDLDQLAAAIDSQNQLMLRMLQSADSMAESIDHLADLNIALTARIDQLERDVDSIRATWN